LAVERSGRSVSYHRGIRDVPGRGFGHAEGHGQVARIKACVRFADAVALVSNMKAEVYQEFGKLLLARNRVRAGSPMEVLAAMQRDGDEDNPSKPQDQFKLF
jgi:hypothetical protein